MSSSIRDNTRFNTLVSLCSLLGVRVLPAIIDGCEMPVFSLSRNMQKDPVLVSTPAVHVPLKINVSKMVRQSCVACGWDMSLMGRNVLTPRCAAQSLCGLSQEVDRSVTVVHFTFLHFLVPMFSAMA